MLSVVSCHGVPLARHVELVVGMFVWNALCPTPFTNHRSWKKFSRSGRHSWLAAAAARAAMQVRQRQQQAEQQQQQQQQQGEAAGQRRS